MTAKSVGGRRRLTAVTALATAGVLALSACGGGDSTDGDTGSGGESSAEGGAGFTFTYPVSNAADSYKELAAKYQEDTGIEITLEAIPGDSYQQSLRTQLQGGNASDLILTQPGSGQDTAVLGLVEAGVLAPLAESSAAAVPESAAALVQVDGQTYGQPTELIPVGLVMNKSTLDAEGLTYPTNTTELLAMCESLAADGKSFLAVAGTVPANLGLLTQSVAATRVYAGAPDWNEQRAAGSVTFAGSQEWKDTIQAVLDMSEAGCFQRGFEGAGFDAITQGMGGGTSLTAPAPGNAAAEIMRAASGTTIQIVPIPPADGGTEYLLASTNYALSITEAASDEAKAAAQAFLDWFALPENSAAFTEISGGVDSSGDLTNLLPQYEPVKSLLESGSYSALPNSTWPNARVYDALSKGVQGLLAGQGDIDTVLASMDSAWG